MLACAVRGYCKRTAVVVTLAYIYSLAGLISKQLLKGPSQSRRLPPDLIFEIPSNYCGDSRICFLDRRPWQQ